MPAASMPGSLLPSHLLPLEEGNSFWARPHSLSVPSVSLW